ncbi:MAG: DUF2232 domain-containing protein [Deltaproteobacteria bacterium]|nr:DUF2232 domain-containing protein [Deltaproteobacteria bacterium]
MKALLLPALISYLLLGSRVLAFLAPFPFLYAAKRWSWKSAVASWCLGLVGIYLIFHLAYFSEIGGDYSLLLKSLTLALYASSSFLGLALAFLEKKSTRYEVISLLSVLVALIVGLLVFFLNFGGDLSSLWGQLNLWMQGVQKEFLLELKSQNPRMAQELGENSTLVVEAGLKLLPGFWLSLFLFSALINLMLAKRVFIFHGLFAKLPPFERLKISFGFVWVTIAVLVLVLGKNYLPQDQQSGWEWLIWLAYNALQFLILLYFFQGLAIASFFSERFLPPGWIRVAFFFFFLVSLYVLGPILVAVGFFDAWLDLRERFLKRGDGGSSQNSS